jgi:hypothetical protein
VSFVYADGMRADMGELLTGAYLKVIENCDVVSYNVRPRGGGLKGLGELDVVGLRFEDDTAFLCECTTHIDGMLYGSGTKDTVTKLGQKAARQIEYADSHLQNFPNRRYMFWSPVVSPAVAAKLRELNGIELIINQDYTARIDELRSVAKKRSNDEGNDAFRLLQILEHLKVHKTK